MRVVAAVLLATLSAACQDPDVPKYDLSPSGPAIQIPTTLKLSVLNGTGDTAKNVFVTASLHDQQNRGIADTMLTFSTSQAPSSPPP